MHCAYRLAVAVSGTPHTYLCTSFNFYSHICISTITTSRMSELAQCFCAVGFSCLNHSVLTGQLLA